jgi:hypothetical protein
MTMRGFVLGVWSVVGVLAALLLVQGLLAGPGIALPPPAGGLEVRVTVLEAKLACVSTAETTIGGTTGWDVVFERCNVHIQNGAGTTGGFGNINGFGNLIIGYNHDLFPPTPPAPRGGSHNLVVGDEHSYSAWGGLVAGFRNTISGPEASVTGGSQNTASGQHASVSGGLHNTADGNSSSVSGGTVGGSVGCTLSGSGDWGAISNASGATGDC